MKTYSQLISEFHLFTIPVCGIQSVAHIIGKTSKYVMETYPEYIYDVSKHLSALNQIGFAAFLSKPFTIWPDEGYLEIPKAEGFNGEVISTKRDYVFSEAVDIAKKRSLEFRNTAYLVETGGDKVGHIAGIRNGIVVDTNTIFGIQLSGNHKVSRIFEFWT